MGCPDCWDGRPRERQPSVSPARVSCRCESFTNGGSFRGGGVWAARGWRDAVYARGCPGCLRHVYFWAVATAALSGGRRFG